MPSADSGAGTDDVDDGVCGADLVEVNPFDVDVVNLGLAGSEEFEGADCQLLDWLGERGGLDESADPGEGAAVGVMVVGVRVANLVLVLGFGVVMALAGMLMGCVGVCSVGGLAVFKDLDAGGGDSAAVDLLDAE